MDSIYKEVKKIIETIDPANLGASGEYDDVVLSLIGRDIRRMNVLEIAATLREIMKNEFGQSDNDAIEEVASKIAKNIRVAQE